MLLGTGHAGVDLRYDFYDCFNRSYRLVKGLLVNLVPSHFVASGAAHQFNYK